MGKRLFDLIAASALLLICLPAMLIISLAVKLDSPGKILFRQVRIGLFGRNFRMLKFRSMRDRQDPEAPLVTAANDARVTRVGSLLRRTKLDELPQLLNVLRGDMSLVGPRPEVPKYVALYPADIAPVVLSVRPGMTDEASIQFRNEEALLASAADSEAMYVREILPRKLDAYVRYATGRTFGGDLRILWRTVWTVIFR